MNSSRVPSHGVNAIDGRWEAFLSDATTKKNSGANVIFARSGRPSLEWSTGACRHPAPLSHLRPTARSLRKESMVQFRWSGHGPLLPFPEKPDYTRISSMLAEKWIQRDPPITTELSAFLACFSRAISTGRITFNAYSGSGQRSRVLRWRRGHSNSKSRYPQLAEGLRRVRTSPPGTVIIPNFLRLRAPCGRPLENPRAQVGSWDQRVCLTKLAFVPNKTSGPRGGGESLDRKTARITGRIV